MEKPQSPSDFDRLNKSDAYRMLADQLTRLLKNETNRTANAANTSALLFSAIPDVNWVGFYLVDGDKLYLGPFQGDVACTTIEIGRGVCGTAFKEKKTILIPNVNEFVGHIACSSLSKSEIVVPIIKNNEVKAVLDIDAPIYNRFNEDDKNNLQQIVDILKTLF